MSRFFTRSLMRANNCGEGETERAAFLGSGPGINVGGTMSTVRTLLWLIPSATSSPSRGEGAGGTSHAAGS